jgi:hypothetical protein
MVPVSSLQGIAGLLSFLLEIAGQVSSVAYISDPVYLAMVEEAFFDSVAPVSASLAEILDRFSLSLSWATISMSPLVMYVLLT